MLAAACQLQSFIWCYPQPNAAAPAVAGGGSARLKTDGRLQQLRVPLRILHTRTSPPVSGKALVCSPPTTNTTHPPTRFSAMTTSDCFSRPSRLPRFRRAAPAFDLSGHRLYPRLGSRLIGSLRVASTFGSVICSRSTRSPWFSTQSKGSRCRRVAQVTPQCVQGVCNQGNIMIVNCS